MKYRILKHQTEDKYRVEIGIPNRVGFDWIQCEKDEYCNEHDGKCPCISFDKKWFNSITDAEQYASDIQSKYYQKEEKVIKEFVL